MASAAKIDRWVMRGHNRTPVIDLLGRSGRSSPPNVVLWSRTAGEIGTAWSLATVKLSNPIPVSSDAVRAASRARTEECT